MFDSELESFKTGIDLRAYAASQGYTLDGKESCRGSAVMRDANGDKIIIKRDVDGHYVYFSVRDDTDHGTILDFAKRRLGLSLGAVRKELRPWVGMASSTPPPYPALPRVVKDRLRVEREFMRMQDAPHHPYLMNERAIAGKMTAAWMESGCERASYAPIVGSGINSTILHYSANDRTTEDGDILLVDAACEYSMYAADITRTLPVNGRFTPRQREIYLIVLGAQKAAIDAFVAGKSTINDRDRQDPNSLDTVAYNYINTHGKDLHGQPLGQYWLHGLGHLMGIDVHDPATYPVVLKPGMVFTIEPGIYIPEEKLGVRIECDFLVGSDGKLIDLDAGLPHTPDEIEAAMQVK